MHNFLGTNLFKPMNVFVDGSSKLHCLVRKHFGEQFAVYGCGSGHQFCNHAKVFKTKQKQKQQREIKSYWAWQQFFAATQAFCRQVFQRRATNLGSMCKYFQFWLPCVNMFWRRAPSWPDLVEILPPPSLDSAHHGSRCSPGIQTNVLGSQKIWLKLVKH